MTYPALHSCLLLQRGNSALRTQLCDTLLDAPGEAIPLLCVPCVINERPCLDISHCRRGHLRPSAPTQTVDVFEAHQRAVAVRKCQFLLAPLPGVQWEGP